jgi:glycosyltransferase involved in cell wall biosynthesis
MKIVHFLLGKANPNTMNGVNKVVHYLATEQLKLKLDVEVWGITTTPNIVSHSHNYPLFLFPVHKTRFILPKQFKDSIKNLRSDTLAHLHSVFIPELFMISRLLRKKKISYVLTAYGGYSKKSLQRNRFLKISFMRLFESHLIRQAKILHAVGESEVDDFQTICKTRQIVVVPNGQDLNSLDDFSNSSTSRSNMIFGYCGRLDALHKGLDILLEGFSSFKCTGGCGELWLIGDGRDSLILRSSAKKLGIDNYVKFWGPMYGNEKLKKIAMFDVFVHTSRWDAVPTAVLEAAALSKPLLISRETNIGTYVERYFSGIVLEKNSPIIIASAMKDLEKKYFTNTLLTIGNRAKMMVKNEFDWPYIAHRINTEVYEIG